MSLHRDEQHRYVAQARFHSPLGTLTGVASSKGLAGLWFDGQAHHPGELDVPVDAEHPLLVQLDHELGDYWRDGHKLFSIPLDLSGTPFQRAIWSALRRIRPGKTSSYSAVAQSAGSPGASRAAGAAIGRNPASIIVPCHRVLGSNGDLTGYAGGLDRKRALLRLEGALADSPTWVASRAG